MGLTHQAQLRSVPPDAFPELFASAPPDLLFSVPRMLQQLPAPALRALQGGIVGGAPVRGALRRHLVGTRLRIGYGQTECSPGGALGEAGEWERDDFLGRPLGCTMVLRETREEGHHALLLQGPNLALGYVEQGRIVPLALSDGWLTTGDLAVAADGGFVFQGRQDELFKLDNGRMVNPVPLELPYDGRILLVGSGSSRVVPLARGELPANFALPIPHAPPRLMPDTFWSACTTPTGKVSRRRAQRLFENS
jgi:AMP-binding enzyme